MKVSDILFDIHSIKPICIASTGSMMFEKTYFTNWNYGCVQENVTQYNTIQYNTIQYNTTQYNTIQYDTTQYNTIKYDTIKYDTIKYDTIQYNTIQYNITQHNTIQYNTIQHKTIQKHYAHLNIGRLLSPIQSLPQHEETRHVGMTPHNISAVQGPCPFLKFVFLTCPNELRKKEKE